MLQGSSSSAFAADLHHLHVSVDARGTGLSSLRQAGAIVISGAPAIAAASTSSQTLTAAQLATGFVVVANTVGSCYTLTLDTAAAIIPALGLQSDGDCAFVTVANGVDGVGSMFTLGMPDDSISIAPASGTSIAASHGVVLRLAFVRTSPTAVLLYKL